MLIELPIHNLIRLFKMASIGKLMGGLIHNLNGPLQNLGLDIEMAHHSLKSDSGLDNDLINKISKRLNRMEEEFDRIDQIIKISSMKAIQDEDYHKPLHLNYFIQQELLFLQTNLYFKHNVRTELSFQDDLPPLVDLPGDFVLALSWFLQSVIEELESREITSLTVQTSLNDSCVELITSTEEEKLAEKFMGSLNKDISSSPNHKLEDNDVRMMLVLMVFKAGNVSIMSKDEPSGSQIILTIPINKEG
ncbi:MAG: hypothetical protein JRC68_02765 [Deltaproteobacteria bacterium]|nr:hypothetical protein [Deltaproteobacteria bacterium]